MSKIQRTRMRYENLVIYAIKTKRLSNHARSERRPLDPTTVTALNIIGVSLSRPPADHIWGRRSACLHVGLVRGRQRQNGCTDE
jgi:hypothetical protein